MPSQLSPRIVRFVIGVLFLLARCASAADFLDPEQAFKFSAERLNDHILIQWDVQPGYHLYAERISIQAEKAGNALGSPVLPKGHRKFDPNFGKEMTHLSGKVGVTVPIVRLAPGIDRFTIIVTSQGCAEAGLCYPPQTHQAEFSAKALQNEVSPHSSDEHRFSQALQSGSLLSISLLFFGLGLLLSFTPCVLPMIPILSSIIIGASAGVPISKKKGFALALAYSLGMMMVYTSMGIAAGLLGEGLAAYLQKPWVLGMFASLLFVFGLAMFDVFKLEMPSTIQNGLTQLSNKLPGGRFSGVFLMGGLSALIVGPCVAAPLAGTLVYISKSGDVLIGAVALLALSFGMSQPLLLTGVSAGKLLPRAGVWMEGVKRFFGLLLFATALWIVNPILPSAILMLAIALLALMAAQWLSAFTSLPSGSNLWRTAGKALGLVLAGVAVLQLLGVASGGSDSLQPLKHLSERRGSPDRPGLALKGGLEFISVRDGAELNTKLATAKNPVIVDFYADWCTSCKEMEHKTFSDPQVQTLMRKTSVYRVDVTNNLPSDRELMKRFSLFGPPAILVVRPNGEEMPAGRVIGYKPPEDFLAQLAPLIH